MLWLNRSLLRWRRHHGPICVSPPSTTSSDPVTKDEASLARNSTAFATSSAVPNRCSGTFASMPEAASVSA
jgi:hypothetical protein